MLDLKFVRENPDIVKQNIKNKFQDGKLPLVDEVIALDAENRATQKEADDLRDQQKQAVQADRRSHGPGKEGRGRRGEKTGQRQFRQTG